MAIQSSLTGHLVFSTLHTNDAAGAVTRLLDLGLEPYLVAGSLLGVVAQRLIRRVCEDCRKEVTLPEKDRAPWGLTNSPLRMTTYVAHGCGKCHQTGYVDRVGIFELLPVTEAIHDLITLNPKGREIVKAARREGMTTLREDAVRKLREGSTTVDEVLRVTHAASTDVQEGV